MEINNINISNKAKNISQSNKSDVINIILIVLFAFYIGKRILSNI